MTVAAMISNLLANRYLLVVGQDYQDWLFRFFWYAIKNENFGKKMSGMLTLKQEDRALIDFLSRGNAFTRIEPDQKKFVNKVVSGIEAYERDNDVTSDAVPQEGTDIFISYSRLLIISKSSHLVGVCFFKSSGVCVNTLSFEISLLYVFEFVVMDVELAAVTLLGMSRLTLSYDL